MILADFQNQNWVYVQCSEAELEDILPAPVHVTDFQTGCLLAEFPRDTTNLIALRLCGLEI